MTPDIREATARLAADDRRGAAMTATAATSELMAELAAARDTILAVPPDHRLRTLQHQAWRLATFGRFDSDAIIVGLGEIGGAFADDETVAHVIRSGLSGQSAFANGHAVVPAGQSVPWNPGVRLETLCLADVEPKPIDWLWKGWIAIGKVSCLAGESGKGKSTILCDIAGRTTRGEPWPDGAAASAAGSVIILAAEDDVEDTLVPRLLTIGADTGRIFTIRAVRNEDQTRRTFNLGEDLARLEKEIGRLADVRLVIIDPVSSYLGKVDSHKNADVRSVLEPLAEMASRLRVAVVCNNHFSKAGGNANNRIIGSVAFVNQARAAFIVTSDADDPDRLLLMPSKMNLAPIKYGLAYRIEGASVSAGGQEIPTSRITWETTPVTISADEALAAHDDNGEVKTAKAEAFELLQDLLSKGEMSARDAATAAKNAGISTKSLRSARTALGVVTRREGFGPGAVWYWSLPSIDDRDTHRCPPSNEGIYGLRGHL